MKKTCANCKHKTKDSDICRYCKRRYIIDGWEAEE